MSQISRVPKGLQDLLGSKNFGDNPSELGGVVAPTLDMFPFLAAERFDAVLQEDFPLTTAIGDGTFAQVVVPDGEFWLLDSIGAGIKPDAGTPITAGDSVSISALISRLNASTLPGNNHPLMHILDYVNVAGAGVQESWLIQYPRLIPVTPGSLISFVATQVNITGLGIMNLDSSLFFYRLAV